MMKLFTLAAVALAAPAAFAQVTTTVPDETTYLVRPGVTVTPSNSPVSERPIPGGAVALEQGVVTVVALQGSGNTAVMGAAPAPGNRYWFNVPRNVDQREDFRRWRGLM